MCLPWSNICARFCSTCWSYGEVDPLGAACVSARRANSRTPQEMAVTTRIHSKVLFMEFPFSSGDSLSHTTTHLDRVRNGPKITPHIHIFHISRQDVPGDPALSY